ncbi:multidrug resistance-associated protein 1-like [Uloborus diversus]|uniref:multidrug resistance-associated protein 1-like n=1 Tax=Uloborus diversus TaxID=327109 RepID=UPI002409B754|nr:multidrug resistance-associated protein 1-like [Uloborus diversus]
MHHNQDTLIRGSILPRSGLKAAIYRKVLRLSSGSRRHYTMGELCNLAEVDSQRIFELVWSINSLWSYPLRIALTVALLWQYLGAACLAGMALMLVLMPLTGLLAVYVHRVQRTQMEWKDSRLRQMSEILNGIKVLKLFAWEQPFMERVGDVRQSEAVSIKKLAFLNGTILFLWISAPFLIAVSSFVTYVLMDEKNVLDPSIAFVSLTLFNKLRSSMSAVPQVIAEVVQSRIAFKRVTDFLLSDEIKPDAVESDTTVGNAVEIDGGSFSWVGGEPPFLRDVTMSVPRGSLTAVVGRVGAGKSALFSAVLGEMVKCGGAIRVMKDIRMAYVAQQAWIQNATLRQNVLFVKPMDRKRYDAALHRCSLKQDLQSLPDGDLTEIGEKGVNLSGGQKQRVSLARALYQDADLYLLDDPLSAVDSHVGNHIFKYVIGPNGALRKKTRILVTHDLSVLPEVDQIFLMSEGRILESGTYEQLLEQKGEFFNLIEEYKKDQAEKEDDDKESVSLSRQNSDDVSELKAQMVLTGSRQLSRSMSRQLSHTDDSKDTPRKTRTLIEKEKVEVGSVKANVFWTYIRNASLPLTLLTLLGFVAYQSFEVGSNVWLGAWSSDEPLPDGSQDVSLRNRRIIVYAVLGIAQGLSALLASFVLAVGSTRASIRFHRTMLWSVLRSPMSFFDTTPIGRILNRFGKDINTVDVSVPLSLSNVMTAMVSAAGAVLIICVNHPIFLLILVPLGVVYLFLQFFYMATSRQVRRLHSVTMSPVLSFFSETASGTSTVRAFGAEFTFVDRQDKLIDTNCVVFLNTTLVNRWLGIRLQLMGGTIVLIAALLTVAQRGTSSAALVGLTLTYALSVTDILATMVRLMTQLETRMVSVERIKEYSSLSSEAPWETGCQLSLEDWPREGAITLRDYKMRYRMNTELILKGVSVHIPAGQKVGLVGRTGAGKSSLALALFRIVEPDEGTLLIDGVDVAMLGLHDLRAKITVIPQDPVMFSGSLRLNLDPLNQHSDQELWSAIEHAHLKDFISGLDGGLNFPVAEGGQNLSVGQRQQLCLARALLKKSKILVLDEATAAVDMATDKLIQGSIRREFADCTVITIAHRLYTVLDYDR